MPSRPFRVVCLLVDPVTKTTRLVRVATSQRRLAVYDGMWIWPDTILSEKAVRETLQYDDVLSYVVNIQQRDYRLYFDLEADVPDPAQYVPPGCLRAKSTPMLLVREIYETVQMRPSRHHVSPHEHAITLYRHHAGG